VIARSPVAGLVLATFVATIAMPGPQVVTHRHAGGEREHVHGDGSAAHVHHHDHGHAHRAHHHRGERVVTPERVSGDGLRAWDGEPREHVHVVAPFQPATAASTAPIVRSTVAARLAPLAPVAPSEPSTRPDRSRGPPSSAHV
jgi:hypothetical protein